ncbi:hypothetical protein BURPSPAST_V0147 [Burkholderia pseudomallei Pasteur 52237]|uniref:Uncharacterized protein n=1 Tax=Burkholderia pseudomallei 1710a TaxID=320371 RepID=A0A0E1W5F1_BURPE|nr:hypothetical protein BURPSPAST_V0147 [Burkholderia pseudomallei Pasteur 52237]EET04857.1 hypothetical protein BURPS1710A_A0994 [Burkholderia pseudomallei 1710a]
MSGPADAVDSLNGRGEHAATSSRRPTPADWARWRAARVRGGGSGRFV